MKDEPLLTLTCSNVFKCPENDLSFFFKDAVTSQVWCFSNNIDYKQMEEPKNDLVMVILLLIFLQK